jgi:hypothetical protein
MNAKKVPGAGWTYMVYDLRDRLVFTQDANMRTQHQWMTTLYDGMNRPTTTGMITYTGTPNQLQQYVTGASTGSSSPGSVTVTGTSPGYYPIQPGSDWNGEWRLAGDKSHHTGYRLCDTGCGQLYCRDRLRWNGRRHGRRVHLYYISTVVDNPIPSGSTLIPLTMTFYDDYTNTPDKQYTTTYDGLLDAGSNQHVETFRLLSPSRRCKLSGRSRAPRCM